jgi:hypothetical protein
MVMMNPLDRMATFVLGCQVQGSELLSDDPHVNLRNVGQRRDDGQLQRTGNRSMGLPLLKLLLFEKKRDSTYSEQSLIKILRSQQGLADRQIRISIL